MKSYRSVKKQLLKNKSVRAAYAALDAEFAVARMVIEQRERKGLTQAALARKVGTKQSAIARLESGSYNPTILFVSKVAKALDRRFSVSLS
ncbi:MAG: helix-turn-helix transcriptional regulator [Candidatus Magasanikbacteria bacterium]|nr:helix-turn-helix transcriptional regulator [Candidatus Magasanikbacteria bacterium]